ncbi:MAG: NAD(P)/FAD-dependent oxidoreductase [Ruminococcus sp.]|nr:NAD(P)/FAD-dependent oxidoreductase [Ruminococcus sp.]
MTCDRLIIGGGASGLFCAVQAAWLGEEVTVVEHSKRVGQKILITGKGRCNVTNNCDAATVMKNIPRNPKFMYSALSRFAPEDTMAFFESLGVPLKTERGNRVFPVSDKAEDIRRALETAARDAGVRIVRDKITSLIIEEGKCTGARSLTNEYRAAKVVVATGGKSYPVTGSEGAGYELARQAGHTVTEIRPSLVPIVIKERDCADMMGLSLRNCTLSLYEAGRDKPLYTELGEMLFTHFGMSGPLVLSASAHLGDIAPDKYRITIDLKPGLSEQKLDERVLRDIAEFPNRDLSNLLRRLLPAKAIPVVIKRSGIEPFRKGNQLTAEERHRLVTLLKGLDFTVKGLRPVEEAIITRGGVSVDEVSPKAMESKLISGLYFIGEVLDVDAYTGGFNLQIAFATAYACANG